MFVAFVLGVLLVGTVDIVVRNRPTYVSSTYYEVIVVARVQIDKHLKTVSKTHMINDVANMN